MGTHERFRVVMWMDRWFDPVQVAVARYVDDEKVSEATMEVPPFETYLLALDLCRDRVDPQLRLW